MDRRDNVVRYNAKKDDKVSRNANIAEVTGVAIDARGLIKFHAK